jgi:hypothetical protein
MQGRIRDLQTAGSGRGLWRFALSTRPIFGMLWVLFSLLSIDTGLMVVWSPEPMSMSE